METTTVGVYREDMEKLKRIKLTESAAQGIQLSFADVLHQILSGSLAVLHAET
jgi:hypothetical protein